MLEGVTIGLLFTAAVAVLTFVANRRLPYKRMLIITGVMLAIARAMGETAPLLLTTLGNDLFVEDGYVLPNGAPPVSGRAAHGSRPADGRPARGHRPGRPARGLAPGTCWPR